MQFPQGSRISFCEPSLCVPVLMVLSCHSVSYVPASQKNLHCGKGTERGNGKMRSRGFTGSQGGDVDNAYMRYCRQK